jgi:hypothetical protein
MFRAHLLDGTFRQPIDCFSELYKEPVHNLPRILSGTSMGRYHPGGAEDGIERFRELKFHVAPACSIFLRVRQ